MKINYFLLISMLISSLSHAMHIEHIHTMIKFKGTKKPIFEWIRDDRDKKFGKTSIITTITNQPPFEKKDTIQTLKQKDFDLIAKGYSFYCDNIKNKNNVKYGAIVINPEQYHFDRLAAQKTLMYLRRTHINKQLEKNNTDLLHTDLPIELSQSITNQESNITTKKNKKFKQH